MSIASRVLDYWFYKRTKVCIDPSRKVQVLFSGMLASHVKESQEITESYGIYFHAGRKVGYDEMFPKIYWETQFGFVLYIRSMSTNVPIAFIGFDRKSKYLLIRQVQGVRGMKEYLRQIYFEKLLYRVVILFGRYLGVEEISVLPASRSDYHPSKNDHIPDDFLPPEYLRLKTRFHIVYNKISQQCGFIWVRRTGTYTFRLS